MRIALTLVTLVLSGTAASAQSVVLSGTVVDARTNRPLAGVRVSLDGQPQSATTTADGRFQIAAVPGKYLLTASVIGFALSQQPVELIAGDEPQVTIRLSEGAGAFEEHLTVSGSTS